MIGSETPAYRGNFLVTSVAPDGPWSEPVHLSDVSSIDPDLAWDDEGNCWCTYAGIGQVRIDPRTGQVLEEPRALWSGTPGAQWPEAPHLYQIDGRWYLMIAEGGTERGHSVSIARGPSPQGPFEPCPANPILTHRSTNRPIQNTGHADLFQAHDGSWWMVFLGVRPNGGSPGYHVLGRETFLAPVTWVDGWPVVGEVNEEMTAPAFAVGQPLGAPPVRDDFDAASLHPRWVSVRSRPAESFSLSARPGWLTLHARGPGLDDRAVTFVGRRQQHPTCRVRARFETNVGSGGLVVRLDERHHYAVEAADGEVFAQARVGPLAQRFGVRPLPSGPVVLRIEIEPGPAGFNTGDRGGGPDLIRLGFESAGEVDANEVDADGEVESAGEVDADEVDADGEVDANGEFVVLAELDGRYLSTEVAGGFTGRVIGMYAATGTIHIDWFDYTDS